jgi:hypothetical protein
MESPSNPVDLPEGKLELSNIIEYTAKNNAIAYKNRTQLESLQDWIRTQLELFNK